MKKINFTKWARYTGILMLLVAFSATLTSCVVHTPNHHHSRGAKVPPGQAKKYYGERSAKRYAPGQQKKQYKKSKHNKGNKRGR